MNDGVNHGLIWAAMLLNFITSLWLLFVITVNWKNFDSYVKRYKFALMGYTFAITFLTAEVIHKHLPVTGYRYLLLTVVSLFLDYALIANRSHQDH